MEEYIVQEGDSIETIVKKFNVPAIDIIKANQLDKYYNLQPGNIIKIPVNPLSAFQQYVVQPRDNLYQIAKKFKTEYYILSIINGINANDYIYPGEVILVPKEDVKVYITRPGDTLQSIQSNGSLEDILLYNQRIYLLPNQLITYKSKNN